MANTVIVANSPWRWREWSAGLAARAELLLAADGGANHLARIGLRPAAVVGDLDSIRPSVRAWLGEGRMVQRPDQDTTDLHKTLAYAFDERGAGGVTVLALLGGRTDHAMENLALLARWAGRGAVDAWTEDARIVPVSGTCELTVVPGQTVSLLPLGRCSGVHATGLRWALRGEALDLQGRTSISNVATATRLKLRVDEGVLLAFLVGAVPPGRR